MYITRGCKGTCKYVHTYCTATDTRTHVCMRTQCYHGIVTKANITGLDDERGIQQTYGRSSTSRNVEPLEVWTCQRTENLKQKKQKKTQFYTCIIHTCRYVYNCTYMYIHALINPYSH